MFQSTCKYKEDIKYIEDDFVYTCGVREPWAWSY